MTDTPFVMEIPAGRTRLAHPALLELRPSLPDVDAFTRTVDEDMRPGGYRLAGVFDAPDDPDRPARAVAGFRTGTSLAWGRYLYVDDLVTTAGARGTGLGRLLMDWVRSEARAHGCEQLHLDSGTDRHPAHRFYLSSGMVIPAFHFTEHLDT
ncbi:GNAT family N-acetyltransferase [Nocardiopsis sp. RSe5-2]|uniref:GNAT family N-acetyltransferase n=1 Tax=Nocardiopsis endophytica TaxID=3018445 RepID=A0ABT4UBG3_9ACTN|nr:GNAT family N-acetyltransferase [Nocardiopsis endophytica]MDA2814314.1 GNAT family N-acetyltransferase [Nocardiopsis endophytica]